MPGLKCKAKFDQNPYPRFKFPRFKVIKPCLTISILCKYS